MSSPLYSTLKQYFGYDEFRYPQKEIDEDLKLYTVYSLPAHKDGTIHKTKADAEKDEGDHYN